MTPALVREFWGRRDPAQFQVIVFFWAYIALGDDPKKRMEEILIHRRWEAIKDILLLAGVVKANAKTKTLSFDLEQHLA